MAATNEPDHELYAFSTDFFTFTSTKSCKLTRGRLSSGIRGVNQVNKKIRKRHFSRLFLFLTDRPTDPFFQAKMAGNENIIDDRLRPLKVGFHTADRAFCAVAKFDFHRIFLSRNALYTHRENTNNGNLFS